MDLRKHTGRKHILFRVLEGKALPSYLTKTEVPTPIQSILVAASKTRENQVNISLSTARTNPEKVLDNRHFRHVAPRESLEQEQLGSPPC